MRAPIGIQIRRKRLALGLSQAALAKAVGISATYLNLIENNKRAIGGKLLVRISERLGLDLDQLSGVTESRSIQAIEELLADPAMAGIEMEPAAIRDFVARFPEAGLALTRLYRLYLDASASIDVYSHRLRSDPLLSQMLHQVLNRISAIRSGAEILDKVPDLTDAEQKRFSATISRESEELTSTVRSLVDYFDRTASLERPISPMANLDEAIIAHRNHFPGLEAAADELRAELAATTALEEKELEQALWRRFGIRSVRLPAGSNIVGQYRYEPDEGRLLFRGSAARSTRIFQMARIYASKAAAQTIEATVEELRFNSEEARRIASKALSSYVAGAMMMPYERFLADAEALRYDIELLAHVHGASFEQAAHRLVTLRRKGAEGVPFGFLRSDRAGRLTKRFPLPGLALPLSGHGCVLWPIFRAFGSTDLVRQVAEFPGGERFLLIAKAVSKQMPSYREEAPAYSIMLACDLVHADRTVYSDGLDLSQRPVAVGASCLLCPRQECGHRQEVRSTSTWLQ